LKMRIEQKVRDIEEAIKNGADYVAEMKSVLQEGIETLNAIVDDGKSDIQAYITQAKTDLTKVKDDATEDITTTANNAKTSVQDTATNAMNSVNSKATEATEHVDSKVTEFNEVIEANGFVTPEKLNEDLTSLEWQKYKLTENDGTIKYTPKGSITDIKTLSPGLYETVSDDDATSQGIPVNNTYVQIKVWEASNGRKEIELTSTYNRKKYFRLFHTGGDRDTGWIEVGNNQTDTGWIPYNTINGVEKNTVYKNDIDNGFDCAYRIIKQGDITTRKLRVNARNLTQGIVFAELPSEFAKNTQTFLVRTPRNRNSAIVEIKADGKLIFQYYSNTTDWIDTDYIYGEFTWHD